MQGQPWLRSPDWARTDPKLASLASQPVRLGHTTALARSIELHTPGVLVLRGPRQVGKSTFLRELAARCLDEGVPGEDVLLLDAERLADRHALLGELEAFLRSRGSFAVVLIDEINSIEKWWLAIKLLVDDGTAANALIVATGSSTLDLAAGADLMPGRRGRRHPVDLELLPVPFPMARERLTLDEYLLTGGLPWSINEYLRTGTIPAHVYQLHASWIEGAFLRHRHGTTSLPHLLGRIAGHVGTPQSVAKLTRDAGLGSSHTTEAYLEILERIFALLTSRWCEPSGGPPAPRKNRKLYPSDPLLFHLFADFGKGWDSAYVASRARVADDAIASLIVESLVAAELRRRHGARPLCHWLGRREIDFVAPEIVEVKYRAHVSAAEFAWVVPLLPRGATLTVVTRRTTARDGRVVLVPVDRWLCDRPDR